MVATNSRTKFELLRWFQNNSIRIREFAKLGMAEETCAIERLFGAREVDPRGKYKIKLFDGTADKCIILNIQPYNNNSSIHNIPIHWKSQNPIVKKIQNKKKTFEFFMSNSSFCCASIYEHWSQHWSDPQSPAYCARSVGTTTEPSTYEIHKHEPPVKIEGGTTKGTNQNGPCGAGTARPPTRPHEIWRLRTTSGQDPGMPFQTNSFSPKSRFLRKYHSKYSRNKHSFPKA